MNNARRKAIRKVINELGKQSPDWEFVEDELNDVLMEEEEARDNMEEYFSETEKYQIVSDNCDCLQEAIDAIDPDDADCAVTIVEVLEQIDGI